MTRYNLRPHGLGIIITQLSFLLAMGRQVTAVVTNTDNIAYDLKRIFKISDERLLIEVGSDGYPDLETDELCTYAPYFTADVVQLFGRGFAIGKRKKPCVALSMHHGCGLDGCGMPYNKFATQEEYNQIFNHLTSLGYDVITINQPGLTIEQKIYLLNELCDFVIGYEGGVGHLAHVLKIPYIVLPWQTNDMGDPGVQPGLWYEAHRFHPDRKTWFLKNISEFLNWDRDKLNTVVDRLYNDLGNNILFDSGTRFNLDTLEIRAGNGMSLTPRIMWCETRGKYTTEFIKQHLPSEFMQKYP